MSGESKLVRYLIKGFVVTGIVAVGGIAVRAMVDKDATPNPAKSAANYAMTSLAFTGGLWGYDYLNDEGLISKSS